MGRSQEAGERQPGPCRQTGPPRGVKNYGLQPKGNGKKTKGLGLSIKLRRAVNRRMAPREKVGVTAVILDGSWPGADGETNAKSN